MDYGNGRYQNMSVREYFIGCALASMSMNDYATDPKIRAMAAVRQADAILKLLENENAKQETHPAARMETKAGTNNR